MTVQDDVKLPTAQELIKEYIRLRTSVYKMTNKYEKAIAPYRQGMDLIENLLNAEINRLDGQGIKTKAGTAFRSTTTSFKVADRDTWFNWVFEHGHRDMLTANVARDAVKEYMEHNGNVMPPGLNLTTIYKIIVRSNDDV